MKAWAVEPFWQWWQEQMDLSAHVPSPALPAPYVRLIQLI
jgi:hypothetical protein